MDEKDLGIFFQRLCDRKFSNNPNFSLKEIFQAAIKKQSLSPEIFIQSIDNADIVEIIEELLDTSYGKFQKDNDLQKLIMEWNVNIVDEMIEKLRGYRLRDTQKAAILCSLISEETDATSKGVLQQIKTGEGKTLIIAVVSIILALMKVKVSIVTSSSVLAKREIESKNGCADLYHAFGIKVGHICYDLKRKRAKMYSTCDVIYGDLTTFQSDYLQDTFLLKNVLNGWSYDVVIVDEVDSMLLDNGFNTLYLAHEIPELNLLQPALTKIWQFVNLRSKKAYAINAEIYSLFFPGIDFDFFAEALKTDDEEAEVLKNHLTEKCLTDQYGHLRVRKLKKVKEELENVKNVKKNTKTKFLNLFHKAIKDSISNIPFLQIYFLNNLREFIKNAEIAYNMEEGVQYQIEITSNAHTQKLETRIVIIDPDTGVDLPTAQWAYGLHQFLQLKHGLALTPISTKAIYVSNVTFFKKFSRIYGFTGTLGTEIEKNTLKELYQVKCHVLSSSFNRCFNENAPIVTKDENSQCIEIFKSLQIMMQHKRSVLIIGESIKSITNMRNNIKHIAQTQLQQDEAKPFLYSKIYKRDSEKLEFVDGSVELPPFTIIFATNLAGRGTDIKISKCLRENGGLHVILAFLPQNIRIEEQAFGRAARNGEPGTSHLIFWDNTITDNETNEKIIELKNKRNLKERQKSEELQKIYETKILAEEQCFFHFAQLFEHQRKRLLDLKHPYPEIILKDITDEYAAWFDLFHMCNEKLKVIPGVCEMVSQRVPEEPQRPVNKITFATKLVSKKLDS
uniref:Chloroplast protein-transporting ATPase n=1 Tax=Panagrolaimus davidi TaxID=227884 RepID=A0A914PQY5_9BILA